MNYTAVLFACIFFYSCTTTKKMNWPDRTSATTGNEFYHRAFAMTWKERDSFAEVNHKWMDYIDVLGNPVLQKLLCDEEYCDFYRYSY